MVVVIIIVVVAIMVGLVVVVVGQQETLLLEEQHWVGEMETKREVQQVAMEQEVLSVQEMTILALINYIVIQVLVGALVLVLVVVVVEVDLRGVITDKPQLEKMEILE